MRLDIVEAHLPQVFSQIQDGVIPKDSIEELICALIIGIKELGCEHVDFRSAAWEKQAESNVIQLSKFREQRKRNLFIEEEGQDDH